MKTAEEIFLDSVDITDRSEVMILAFIRALNDIHGTRGEIIYALSYMLGLSVAGVPEKFKEMLLARARDVVEVGVESQARAHIVRETRGTIQ